MSFTPHEISAFIIALFGFLLTAMNVFDKIMSYKKEAQKPEDTQNERITALETRVAKMEDYQEECSWRGKRLAKGNEVYMRAMLAMMTHALDGNHVEQLKEARDELNEYLLHAMN